MSLSVRHPARCSPSGLPTRCLAKAKAGITVRESTASTMPIGEV
jgi:hypothetical protein